MSKSFQRIWNVVCWSGTMFLSILIGYGLTRMGPAEGQKDENVIPVIVKGDRKERQDSLPYANVRDVDIGWERVILFA